MLVQDPLVEVQAAAAAVVEERDASVRAYEQERAKNRAHPAYEDMVLRSSRFLEIQTGADLSLVSDPVKQILTEDMQARAADLAAQNAELVDLETIKEKKKPGRKRLLLGGPFLSMPMHFLDHRRAHAGYYRR